MALLDLILRGVQLFLVVLITALIGNALAEAYGGNPATLNYAIFVAVYCWLVLIYTLAAAFVASLVIPIVLLVCDGLAVLFTFVAGVAIAAQLGANNCGNTVSLLLFCCVGLRFLVDWGKPRGGVFGVDGGEEIVTHGERRKANDNFAKHRPSSSSTSSQPALPTPTSAAAKCKPPASSSGSSSRCSASRSSLIS